MRHKFSISKPMMATLILWVSFFYFLHKIFLIFFFNLFYSVSPPLEGLSPVQAQALLSQYHLRYVVAGSVASSYPTGTIAAQNPAPYDQVKQGRVIQLFLSGTTSTQSLPNVVGLNYLVAQQVLNSGGYTVNVLYFNSPTIANNQVIAMDPPGGNSNSFATVVTLLVSSGSLQASTTVPSLIGLDLDSAKSSITDANLVVGNVTTADGNGVPSNTVLSCTPSENSSVSPGTSINLTVAK